MCQKGNIDPFPGFHLQLLLELLLIHTSVFGHCGLQEWTPRHLFSTATACFFSYDARHSHSCRTCVGDGCRAQASCHCFEHSRECWSGTLVVTFHLLLLSRSFWPWSLSSGFCCGSAVFLEALRLTYEVISWWSACPHRGSPPPSWWNPISFPLYLAPLTAD